MTNREYMNSLSNSDFVKYLIRKPWDIAWDIYYWNDYFGNYEDFLNEWLEQEHKEGE